MATTPKSTAKTSDAKSDEAGVAADLPKPEPSDQSTTKSGSMNRDTLNEISQSYRSGGEKETGDKAGS